jgi:hypothetical protein
VFYNQLSVNLIADLVWSWHGQYFAGVILVSFAVQPIPERLALSSFLCGIPCTCWRACFPSLYITSPGLVAKDGMSSSLAINFKEIRGSLIDELEREFQQNLNGKQYYLGEVQAVLASNHR